MPPDKPNKRQPLDRPAIVAAAMQIADREGVAALTMRRVAEQVGFKVMALYNHVANKDELLGLMVDAVAAEIDTPSADLDPLDAVRAVSVATRAAFNRHPWVPAIWLSHIPGPARTGQMEYLLRTLDRSGLSAELAHHGFHAVNNHVLGYTLQANTMSLESGGDPVATARRYVESLSSDEHAHTIDHVEQHLSGHTDSTFELVLDLILEGLVRLDGER